MIWRHLVIFALVMAPVLAESPELSYYWPYGEDGLTQAGRMLLAFICASLVRLLLGSTGGNKLQGAERVSRPLLTGVIAAGAVGGISGKYPKPDLGIDFLVSLGVAFLGEVVIVAVFTRTGILLKKNLPEAIAEALTRWVKGGSNGKE